ncbi:MAG: hypothetical protein HYZ94_03160 [Candidatus Omnitrophica bacterium]|nr:hypothetical protein [Candidatus Omnitrophota bacterium]
MSARRGFTLVEAMICCVMAAGMCLVLAVAVRASQRDFHIQQNAKVVSHELRRGMQEMCRELAGSSTAGMSVPADGVWYNAITYQVPQDQDNDGTVLDAANNIEWSVPITLAVGGADNNRVLRTEGAATRVLSYGVTALQFRRQAATPQVVEINLGVQRGAINGGFNHQANLSSRVRLRN